MVVYKEKAFNEKAVWTIHIYDNYDSRKKYRESEVRINLKTAENNYEFISYKTDSHDNAISILNEITQLINEREEQLLKLQGH